jgi:hypothetical protein
VTLTRSRSQKLDAAPAAFHDRAEELRMGLSNEQLIHEAVECNHAGVGPTTIKKYEGHLVHFSQYLASVHRSDLYQANKKQVRLFMRHLEKPGGANPDRPPRCEWCRARGCPDGLKGPGWSASLSQELPVGAAVRLSPFSGRRRTARHRSHRVGVFTAGGRPSRLHAFVLMTSTAEGPAHRRSRRSLPGTAFGQAWA